jgi:hypothetical protein
MRLALVSKYPASVRTISITSVEARRAEARRSTLKRNATWFSEAANPAGVVGQAF